MTATEKAEKLAQRYADEMAITTSPNFFVSKLGRGIVKTLILEKLPLVQLLELAEAATQLHGHCEEGYCIVKTRLDAVLNHPSMKGLT